MSLISLPTIFCPRDFSLVLNVVQRASSSPFSGSEQVVDLLNERWACSLTLPARRSSSGAALEAFIASMRGMTNTVALYHFARPVPRGTMRGSPTTINNPALVGGASLVIAAAPAVTLLAGDLIGVSGLLLMVAADCVANGSGNITVPLVNRLRKQIAAGTAVVWDRPSAPFRFASPSAVQYVPGYSPEVSFDFVEAIS